MKKLLFIFLFCTQFASAADWYIRQDGGTATRCTGHTNAADPGSGTGQACALKHPFWMMNPSTMAWRSDFLGGDVVHHIVAPGATDDIYYLGEQNGGLGTDWNALGFTGCGTPSSGFNTNCELPISGFPAGSAGNLTKWYGSAVGSCHISNGLTLQNPTQYYAVSAPFYGFSMQGDNYADVECIDITHNQTCTGAGTGVGQCGSSNNFFNHCWNFSYLTNTGPSNSIIKDIGAHGCAQQGSLGGYWNTIGSGTTTLSYMYMYGNGGAGMDWDGGGCVPLNCLSVGTLNMSHIYIYYAGCAEVEPNGGYNSDGLSNNGVNYCYSQSTAGNGDCIAVTPVGTGFHLTVTDSKIAYCTQDNFDLLHLGDNCTTGIVVDIERNWSYGPMGQTYKLGGCTDLTAVDNFSNGNCKFLRMTTIYPNTLNPAGYNTGLVSDYCRASGDEWFIAINDGHTAIISNNTSVGYGGTMWDLGCSNSCTTSYILKFNNNINRGYGDPDSGILASGFFFETVGPPTMADPFTIAGSQAANNNWSQMRSGTCPQDVNETGVICADPLMQSEALVDTVNPNLTSSSTAVLAAGLNFAPPIIDYYGNTFANPRSVGFMQYGGTPPPPAGKIKKSGNIKTKGNVKN